MQLETRDLRMMARLLRSQDKMVATRDEESSSEALYASEPLVAVGAD
jgi:hypothetical protein